MHGDEFLDDGADIFLAFKSPGNDIAIDGNNVIITSTVVYGSAAVNGPIIPEPGTAALLGLGLLGAVGLARRGTLRKR